MYTKVVLGLYSYDSYEPKHKSATSRERNIKYCDYVLLIRLAIAEDFKNPLHM